MLADREMNESIQVNLKKADSLLRGDKAYIYEQLKHRDKLHHTLRIKRYWTSVGGEIASFWGNQRKACDISKRGLGMMGNSGPLLSTLWASSILTMRWLSFLSPVGHGQEIHHPWTSSVVCWWSLLSFLLPPILNPHHPRWFLQHWCSRQNLFLPSGRWLGEFGHACRLLLSS